MKILDDIKLDFTDVLITPKRSQYSSRSEVSLERTFKFKYSPHTWTGVPIFVSNMDTTGTIEMALELQKHKVLTCLHKYYTYDELANVGLDVNYFAVSTGIGEKDLENLDMIVKNINPKFICIDVANGYMSKFIESCKEIREKYPDKILIAGNVCTSEGVLELVMNGKVDIVKVGIGSGSCCTTRKQTGIGMPQFSAVIECADTAHGLDAHIVSDGGLQVVGDFSKAYGAGADFVMSGSMFAGHTESGGELIKDTDSEGNTIKSWKIFYGMSSDTAMNKYSGGVAKYRSREGKTVKIEYRGPVENTILNIQGGIRSTMTYIGAKKIKDIPKCTTFIRVNRQLNTIYNGREV
jgi:GMP reductase|uniref:GMP reductase n=1 Tax=viral metagenome TaxID=1070528 RepID=A0A6C0E8W9_9ZZZZ